MLLRMQVISRNDTGFARYCPSVCKAFGRLFDKSHERAKLRRFEVLLSRYSSETQPTEVVREIKKSSRNARLVIGLLAHPDHIVRSEAALTLGKAAKEGTNISPSFPSLAKALSDKDKYVRANAAYAFEMAALNGMDISEAHPTLTNCLTDADFVVRRRSKRALSFPSVSGTLPSSPVAASL
jgi:HEAT repeat protein